MTAREFAFIVSRAADPSSQLLEKKTGRRQPLFELLVEAAVEVRSTGARGASQQ